MPYYDDFFFYRQKRNLFRYRNRTRHMYSFCHEGVEKKEIVISRVFLVVPLFPRFVEGTILPHLDNYRTVEGTATQASYINSIRVVSHTITNVTTPEPSLTLPHIKIAKKQIPPRMMRGGKNLKTRVPKMRSVQAGHRHSVIVQLTMGMKLRYDACVHVGDE